jgi:NAD(P)-dependent dehydrogenase (short-subunit alcohol dehydrogenase family)
MLARPTLCAAATARGGEIPHHDDVRETARPNEEDAAVALALQGKSALITGASKGIGLGMATAFAREGAAVMISSRKQEGLDAAAAGIREEVPGAHVATFAANAGEPDQAEACVAAAVDQLGGIDVLVNNAGTNPVMGRTIDADLGAWDKTFRVNVRGALVWTQHAWRATMEQHGGSVINISSVGGISGTSGIGAYNITKAALIHLTKVLAVELAPQVRVNAIAPGLVRTDFARALWEPGGEDAGKYLPLQRLGEPDDISGGAVFLASDAARWVTGHVLVIDGGALVSRSPV